MWGDTQYHTTLQPSTACYGDGSIVLHVDNVRTSQETYNGPPRPVTDIDLFLYVDYVRTSKETAIDFHGLLQG
jgi:hypothetical protein